MATADIGANLILGGVITAIGGAVAAGPGGGAPGTAIATFGVTVYGFGSAVAFIGGVALGAQGDTRAAAISILDILGGRQLKRIPDQLAPGFAQAVTDVQNAIVDGLDSLDGIPHDDFPVCE